MANTYTQIYIQTVFAVEGRQNLIPQEHRDDLCKYITGIVRNDGSKLIAVNGMSDHIHVLVGLDPSTSVSDLVRDIKANSSRFINQKGWLRGRFNWQEGYGAFSYSRSHVDRVVKYIMNQEAHHSRRSFKSEYLALLKKFEIPYDERYMFRWIE